MNIVYAVYAMVLVSVVLTAFHCTVLQRTVHLTHVLGIELVAPVIRRLTAAQNKCDPHDREDEHPLHGDSAGDVVEFVVKGTHFLRILLGDAIAGAILDEPISELEHASEVLRAVVEGEPSEVL